MIDRFSKKKIIRTLLAIYFFSYILHNFFFINFKEVFAEEIINKTDIVAVIVDKDIYDSQKTKIQRYATKYIQQKISNSVATVIPINTKNFKAPDIVRVLENMYFDGLEDKPSKLVGVVLIGDIPLPVVENNDFVYPSIYPYVDFENQQFIYNADKGFFTYNDNPNGQAEIWHGIINYGKDKTKYEKFFTKLINYQNNPGAFIDSKIWYDDFVATKENFLTDNITYYVNNFLFTEDTSYRRFTNLMLDILKGEHESFVQSTVEDFTNNLPSITSKDPDEAAAAERGQTIQTLMDKFNGIMGDISEESNNNSNTETQSSASTPPLPAPTLTLKKLIEEFIKTYDTLLSTKYLTRIRDNVQTPARRYQENIDGDSVMSFDSHYNKTIQNDTIAAGNLSLGINPILTEYNYKLEKALNEKVNGYAKSITVLTKTTQTDGKKKERGVYENFYFGKKASLIDKAVEFSAYRGTFQNLDSISGVNYTEASDPLRSVTIGKSIGSSYKIFSQQIEANRGYNLRNTEQDLELFQQREGGKRYESPYYNGESIVRAWKLKNGGERKEKNKKDRTDVLGNKQTAGLSEEGDEIVNKNRGGATPITLDMTTNKLKFYSFKDARKPIYDIAGSYLIDNKESEANSYLGYIKYGSIFRTQLAGGDVADIYPRATVEGGKGGDNADLGRAQKGVIFVPKVTLGVNAASPCPANYDCQTKQISSIVYNISPTPEQINGIKTSAFGIGSPLSNLYKSILGDINFQKTNLELLTFGSTQNTISNNINGIDTNTITSVPTSTLQSENTTQIAERASELQTINATILTDIYSTYINSITGELEKLDSFLISSISQTSEYKLKPRSNDYENPIISKSYGSPFTLSSIPQRISQYQLENRTSAGFTSFNPGEVIFTNTWITELNNSLSSLQSTYGTFKTNFTTFKNNNTTIINNITNKISGLDSKKTAIKNLVTCGTVPSTYKCGCDNGQKYYELCSAIDSIKSKLTTIKTTIEKVNAEFNKEFDNENIYYDRNNEISSTSDTTPSFLTTPFATIDFGFTYHNTNGITSDISTTQSIFNNITKIPDAQAATYPTVTSVKGMDMTTQSRPIDNIRNVTFLGNNSKDIKFNYPNLYEVETFTLSGDRLLLKTADQISLSIKKYLTDKVTEYNNQLAGLLPIDTNIFINILGEDTITDLGKLMYYQNITRQEKTPQDTILEDINETKYSFDINQKTSYIVQNYLKAKNDQGPLVTPTYNEGGYEVAFINSDGQDYIKAKPVPTEIKEVITTLEANGNKRIQYPEESDFEQDMSNECNFDPSGSELIFDIKEGNSPWVDAFKCWMKEVAKKPFDVKIDFGSSLGTTMSTFVGEADQSLENRNGSFGSYKSQRSALDTEISNTETITNAIPSQQATLTDISNYGEIRLTSSGQEISTSRQLGNQTPNKQLKIFSSRDLGKRDIKISATGDNCLIINNTDLCKTKLTSNFNPYSENKTYNIFLNGNKAGMTVVVVNFCIPSTNTCISKASKIEILADPLNKVTIISPDNTLAGGQIPVKLEGKDQYNNTLGLVAPQVSIYVNKSDGYIGNNGFLGESISFSNFNNTNFIYTAPDIKDTQKATIYFTGNGITQTKSINVVKGYLDIYNGSNKIFEHNNLNSIKPLEISLDGLENLTTTGTNIPKIILSLKRDNGTILKELDAITLASTKNNLISVGQKIDGKFKKNGNLIIKDGTLEILLYPSFRAGEDTLNISIPGLETVKIPVIIKPGKANKINITSDVDTTIPNEKININLKVTDQRDNTTQEKTNITIKSLGALTINGSEPINKTVTGEYNFEIQSKSVGGEGYIYAEFNPKKDDQSPGYKDILVQDQLLPTTGLNIMYLNLLGTDRGNQRGYFSENTKSGYIDQIMNGSDKLLAVTTQLIDPIKLKSTDVIITQTAQVKNLKEKQINLTIQSNKLTYNIQNLGSIDIGASKDFTLKEIADINELTGVLLTNKTIIYLPEITDSIITSNEVKSKSIIINGNQTVLDLSKGTLGDGVNISLSTEKTEDYSTWLISIGGKAIGKLFIYRNDDHILTSKTTIDDIDYKTIEMFAEASTNGTKGIGFYNTTSSFAKEGYQSVEDNSDYALGLGFTNNYKNVTYFGNGKSVGESTVPFGSQFLVNYGDPLLTKVSPNTKINQTDFDGGLGDPIYSDPERTIFKVIPIDFNDDGLEDIIAAYQDGLVRIFKNYGGDHPYNKAEDLMIIADSIKDIIVGDMDGDTSKNAEHYPEIMIWTNSNKLKIYKNDKGVFDVDGYLACLNVNTKPEHRSETPEDIGQATQIFFQDMDQDGNLDIITNDLRNDIKIFYGGTTNGGGNYYSNLKYACDDGRYDRQKDNTKLVKNLGLKIDENLYIQDKSVIHRRGLYGATGSDLGDIVPPAGIDENSLFPESRDGKNDEKPEKKEKREIDKLKDLGDTMTKDGEKEASNFINNLDAYISQGIKDYTRYINSPIDTLPAYEKNIELETILYAQSSNLSTGDNVSVYKQYEDNNGDILEAGDIVTVTTTILALAGGDTRFTYLENIQLPANSSVIVDDENRITSFKFLTNTGNLTLNRDIDSPYDFMLDNAKLAQSGRLEFSYDFVYNGAPTSTIDVVDTEIRANETLYAYNLIKDGNTIKTTQFLNKREKDETFDIIAYPTNSCKKYKLIMFNTNTGKKKEYSDVLFKTQDKIDADNKIAAQKNQDAINDATEQYTQPTDLDSVQNLPGMDQVFESRDINSLLAGDGASINIDTSAIDQATAEVQKKIDDALKGACQGFKISKNNECQGIPMPFNQAFLAPGNYHLFGCTKLSFLDSSIGKGLPIISFPTNCTIPIWPPCPAGAGGLFGGEGSQFRVYAVPTLTMGLGLAICLGPYSLGKTLPKPFRDMGGNCVVFSIPPITNCKDTSNNGGESSQIIDASIFETIANGTCNSSFAGGNTMVYQAGNSSLKTTQESPLLTIFGAGVSPTSQAYKNPPLLEGNFFGISLDQKPTKVQQVPTTYQQGGQSITNMKFDFGGGEAFELKSGEKIDNKILSSIKKGLIKCIVQDWLDKQILYLVSNLTKFTINVTFPDISQLGQGFDKLNSENLKQLIKDENQKDISGGYTKPLTGASFKEATSKQFYQNIGNKASNPFDAIKTLFNEVPLVNINTKDITVKVPTLSSEEITKYLAYLKTRNQTFTKTLGKRLEFINTVLAFCGTIDKAEAQEEIKDIQEEIKDTTDETKITNLEKEIKNLEEIINKPELKGYKELGSDINLIGNNLQLTFTRLKTKPRLTASVNYLNNKKQVTDLSFDEQQRLDRSQNRLDKVGQCGDFVGGLGGFFKFYENSAQLTRAIKQNINALEQYKAFPLQLGERIHVSDRYITEVSSVLSNFVGSINYRLNTNAIRFSKYVDAIILLMGVMKTWQALIDFSTDRSKKCGKCTNDDYGSQSCSLSFLCPTLPVLKIPNFKIPSLYIDFSHINLGIDITLPNFNFKPMTISLPHIPNLPNPPQFELYIDSYSMNANIGIMKNLNVPTIPILPSPPQLPELPSFIPNITFQLPTIPPAPRVPKISSKIELTIEIATFVAKIYCIMKGNIGLVGEAGIKQKVEQGTQRTRDVPIFDEFDLTLQSKEKPLKGFDYKLDAYLDLKYNFDGFYSFLNNVVQPINSLSDQVQSVSQNFIDEKGKELNQNDLVEGMEKIQNIQIDNINGYVPKDEDEVPMVEYAEAKQDLLNGLRMIENKTKEFPSKETNLQIDQIYSQINTQTKFNTNNEYLDSIEQQALAIIENKQAQNKQLATEIKGDYDKFLITLSDQNNRLVNSESLSLTLKAPLFTTDKETTKLINSQGDPTQAYIDMNKKVIDGYVGAIENGSPESLNMTQDTYDKSKEYLLAINDKIESRTNKEYISNTPTYTINNEITTTNPTIEIDNTPRIESTTSNPAPEKLIAQSKCTTCEQTKIESTGPEPSGYSPDLGQFINGIFVDVMSGDEKLKYNVVKSDENITKIGKNYKSYDLNNDDKDDILMRDDNNIYIKYAYEGDEPNNVHDTAIFIKKYYLSDKIDSPQDLVKKTKDGYIDIGDISIKMTDSNLEVKNFKMQGQDFESIKFGWTNSKLQGDQADGYLIRLNQRVDTYNDKAQTSKYGMTNKEFEELSNQKYVLILPEGSDITGSLISLGDGFGDKKPVKSLLTGTIIEVKFYDPSAEKINITLIEIPRTWQYAQISSLNKAQKKLSSSQADKFSLYEIASTRSNQIVAGRQIISDSIGPIGEFTLFRPQINETITTGDSLNGFVSTNYNINGNRTDNVAVQVMWIEKDNEIIHLQTGYNQTGFISLTGLFFTGEMIDKYYFGAQDFNGNVTRQQISLDIKIPNIDILEVNKLDDENGQIIAQIENDLDEGNVIFQRLRNNTWKEIVGTKSNSYSGFSLTGRQTIITGEVFSIGDSIGLFNNAGEEIGSLNPTNGQIKILPAFETGIDIKLDLTTHIPLVKIIDKANGNNLFQINLPIEELVGGIKGIEMMQGTPNYQILTLPDSNYGIFNGGYCIKSSDECILYLSEGGQTYIPSPYSSSLKGSYIFDNTNKNIQYQISDQSDNGIATINLKFKPNN